MLKRVLQCKTSTAGKTLSAMPCLALLGSFCGFYNLLQTELALFTEKSLTEQVNLWSLSCVIPGMTVSLLQGPVMSVYTVESSLLSNVCTVHRTHSQASTSSNKQNHNFFLISFLPFARSSTSEDILMFFKLTLNLLHYRLLWLASKQKAEACY